MDIATPAEKYQNLTYKDDTFEDVVEALVQSSNESGHHLSLFLGVYLSDKKKALEKISNATGLSVEHVDFNDVVSKSEDETFKNIDEVFEKYQSSHSILYFKNGDKLCGAYTGFTHSRVKYATPQERYFLKKVQEYEGVVIVDITQYTAADKTLRRAAKSVISFPLPDSTMKRFFWHLKNYTLHGFELRSKRPEAYGEAS
ncbi:hypothetical protein G3570_06945 [Balneolaceae bacterium YR4-1]|uniref:Uncharacterized protein n=1 Tax=Halalkalibaculum roseum TaxID=2709311 RepID=A0A6M1SU59_9BACT|nr:hypothetical protein [Halalkalibaculum roseum]NGP76362.1 hypothetical protein [Halalkalibaculum roseum]